MRPLAEDLIRLYAARIGARVAPRDSLQHWTRATKEILTAFAGQQRWTSICTGVRNRDFLLDFIAVDPQTEDIRLAAETEWGPLGAVAHEFRKLLYVKSDLKIMICGQASGGEKLCLLLQEIASRYPSHVAGETYVLLDVSESEMCVRSYMWKADTSGRADVQFRAFQEAVPFRFAAVAAAVVR